MTYSYSCPASVDQSSISSPTLPVILRSTFHAGRLLWCGPLPSPPLADVLALYGSPPQPFHAPALAAGLEVVEISSQKAFDFELASPSALPRIAFIYSLQPWHLFPIIFHRNRIPFIFYYQNVWPCYLPLFKRFATWLALRMARVVLLQDSLCINYFAPILKPGRVLFFPWFVDEQFFDPALCSPQAGATEPWLFVPGDRARLDQVVLAIAKRLPIRVLRVSRHFGPGVLDAYALCPNVQVRHFVPWAELRDLYASASVVLNVVDDTHNSAGMTTFLEALAMNARVITPANHSSSGYQFEDGFKPYQTVDRVDDVDSWLREIYIALEDGPFRHAQSPRNLVLELAGSEATSARWHEVFNSCIASAP